MQFNRKACEKRIGYTFQNENLLRECFTHKSFSNEVADARNNERLEFFGDKVLDFIVTEALFVRYPKENEGQLTERRKNLVSKKPLTDVVVKNGYDDFLIFGKGLKPDDVKTEKYYSSLYEAIVAGIYLDGGTAPAKEFVIRTLLAPISKGEISGAGNAKDPKNVLQEITQKKFLGSTPVYKSESVGTTLKPRFVSTVFVKGKPLGTGEGSSRKEAEKNAAKKALEIIK